MNLSFMFNRGFVSRFRRAKKWESIDTFGGEGGVVYYGAT